MRMDAFEKAGTGPAFSGVARELVVLAQFQKADGDFRQEMRKINSLEKLKETLSLFRLQHLPAAIHAGLQVYVVRTAQLAGILVFHIGRSLERIGRTAHPPLRRRRFSFRYSHCILRYPVKTLAALRGNTAIRPI